MPRKIKVAVDQTANIDDRTREQLGIETLPIHITNLPQDIEEAVQQRDYKEFYRLLDRYHKKPSPGTQASSVLEIREILEQMIITEDCDIICFVVGGNLSAIYDNTVHAAAELMRQYPNRIAVVGEQAFLSLEMLAEIAAEFIQSGKTFDETVNFIQEMRNQTFVLGEVFDLRRLRRTGRVPIPKTVTSILQPFMKALRLTPFFILESNNPITMKLVTKRRLSAFVINTIGKRVGFKEPLLIKLEYTGSEIPSEAFFLKDVVTSQDDFVITRPIDLKPASPVVGVHTGSSLIALGVMGLGYHAISTEVLLRVFIEAQNELKNLRSAVNAINVFPVRDGDTGTNLLTPLIGVTADIDSELPVGEALNQIVTRLARTGGGYSGGALSAFFLGFNSYVHQYEKGNDLHLETLVGALRKGTERCYEYFGEDAKEGTILSVMRACEQGAKKAFDEFPTFRNVLISAYLSATDELLNPKIQEVEILRQQKLVDAGGFGFTLFLWAFLRTLGLHRESRVCERYQYLLREVRRHGVHSQKLIYRPQPLELRGYCVEGCVRGEVAKELQSEFLKLDNRLPNTKMTFNVVDGTTHFHIHVSEGLEEQVHRIASRFGYIVPPKPPTRLSKRRREIYQFRLVSFFTRFKYIPRDLIKFFGNWVLYALFFPVMWLRQHHQFKKIIKDIEDLRLVHKAFEFIVGKENQHTLVLDLQATVIFSSDGDSLNRRLALEQIFPIDVAQELRAKLKQIAETRQPVSKFECYGYKFEVVLIVAVEGRGYLIRYN